MSFDPTDIEDFADGEVPIPKLNSNNDVIRGLLSTQTVLGVPYDVPFFIAAKPTASQILLSMPVVTPFNLSQDLAGSLGFTSIAATGAVAFDIRHKPAATAEVSIGSINFAIGALVATFVFSAAVSLEIGDELKIIAPAVADATLAGIRATLKGIT